MKKLLFILLILMFASSASATIYRWVDERGVTSFADDYDKIPPRYRSSVEEVSMPKGASNASQITSGKGTAGARSGEKAKQQPPIAQALVREGDFAIKLVESLKLGKPTDEAEAESMLASVGIAPKNGWIADYPVTPDIIGELENAVGEAADAKRLSMAKNEALKALRTTAVEFELPIVAEIPGGYTESPPPPTPQYTEPPVVDNYYYAEGPPVITYYPPPWDYSYLYAWIPTPFWCSGYYFPGYYILNDFHRRVHHGHGHGHGHGNGHGRYVTNHVRDHQTGRIATIDPGKRHEGRTLGVREATHTKGFRSTEARSGARSIFERSRERAGSDITSRPMTHAGLNNRNSVHPQSRSANEKQVYNKQSNPPDLNNRNGNNGRPPATDHRISRTPGETGLRASTGRTFSRPESVNRQNGISAQRHPSGQTSSFHPPSQGSGRSFSPGPQGGTNNRIFSQPNSMSGQNRISAQTPSFHPPAQGGGRLYSMAPQGGSQRYGSFSGASGGFSAPRQESNRFSGFGQGGSQHYGSSSGASRGFTGSHQGGSSGFSGSRSGGSGGSFGRGGTRF